MGKSFLRVAILEAGAVGLVTDGVLVVGLKREMKSSQNLYVLFAYCDNAPSFLRIGVYCLVCQSIQICARSCPLLPL
jgi:hypothetical protein